MLERTTSGGDLDDVFRTRQTVLAIDANLSFVKTTSGSRRL
jgi:hypothetical protein